MVSGIKWGVLGGYFKTPLLWGLLAVLVSTNSCSYLVGRSHQKAAQAAAFQKEAVKQVKAVDKELKKRTPQVAKKETVSIAAKQRVATAKENIYYATSNRKSIPDCDLTAAELDGYVVLTGEINAAVDRSSAVQPKRIR